MKKYIVCFIFYFGLFASMAAQNIKYQYVRVPEKFDFLKEVNQYQLNALTAFLFEKYGFKTLYKTEIPQGANSCDVLQANVHSDSNLFSSKLYITLEDCENRTVFTSRTGSSREKDFQVSYHEALRDAFVSLKEFDNTLVVAEMPTQDIDHTEKAQVPQVIVDPIVTSEEIEEVEAEQTSLEGDNVLRFVNGPIMYLLKRSSVGYDLYKEGEQEKFASLMKSGGGDNYLYSSKNISGNAFFDTEGNLVVEYLDPDSQQLITVTYKLKAQ